MKVLKKIGMLFLSCLFVLSYAVPTFAEGTDYTVNYESGNLTVSGSVAQRSRVMLETKKYPEKEVYWLGTANNATGSFNFSVPVDKDDENGAFRFRLVTTDVSKSGLAVETVENSFGFSLYQVDSFNLTTADGTATATATVYNYDAGVIAPVLILAVYNSDGTLKTTTYTPGSAKQWESATLNAQIAVAEGESVQAYVWKSLVSLQPLTPKQ